MQQRPIHHTFGPLATRAQVARAFVLQFLPWKWRRGPETEMLRTDLEQLFPQQRAALFDTGRAALLALLQVLELRSGDEVIVQGYTCAVVPNAIRAAGATPVYVDINPRTLTLDPALVRAAITRKTRVVICQHTFGIPADMSALRLICDEKDIALVEDCAHVLPDAPSERIGAVGDAVLLSFGRDKAISGVTGGALLTRHFLLAKRLRDAETQARDHTLWTILNLIDYPLRYAWAHAIWKTHLAKIYLRGCQWLRLLPPVLTQAEKAGTPSQILFRMPNACAALALDQLHTLTRLNEQRATIASLFAQAAKEHRWPVVRGILAAAAPQKFPLLIPNAAKVRVTLKQQQIYLDDGWCGAVVNPPTVDQRAVGYERGMCPHAEKVAQEILTLPTHPTMSVMQAKQLVQVLAGLL